MSQRLVESYYGIELVAAFHKGVFQGKAWGKKLGVPVVEVQGSSLDDVMAQLRRAVDSPALREKFKEILVEKHGEFLRRKGIVPEILSVVELIEARKSLHRSAWCWVCASAVDNEMDFECRVCQWIVCTGCGACGCAHPDYGPEIRRAYLQREVEKFRARDGSKTFTDYAAAAQFAKAHAGSVLLRQGDEGWIVRLPPKSAD